MEGMRHARDYSLPELMAAATAREIKNGEKVFVGIGVPLIAGGLAVHTHAPRATLVFEGGYIGGRPPGACTSVADNALGYGAPYITSLWRTFCDLQRGYFDLAIIGGAQVDKYGNVNSTAVFGIGNYQRPAVRLTGSGGANDMMSSARKSIIMARLEKRRFLPRVDYVTSPGYLDGPGAREREGLKGEGPIAVITDKAIFRFDEDTKEMYLGSTHPHVSVDEVKKEVSWDLKVALEVKTTEPPTEEEVEFMRKHDPTDVILRRTRLYETLDFKTWAKVTKESWIEIMERKKEI